MRLKGDQKKAILAWNTACLLVFLLLPGLGGPLGYGDLGCYGQKLIQTPRLDRMAAEGMRFTALNQVHAHNDWPDFLYRGTEKVPLPNEVQLAPAAYGGFHSGWATKRVVYSQDLFAKEALAWIETNKAGPFFPYLALTLPHANNEAAGSLGNGSEVLDHGIYAGKDGPDPDKGQAAMITYLDRDVGRLLDHLEKLGLAEDTLVLFSSDNGPHMESQNDPLLFNPSGPLRGMKRDLTDGGIRVPLIAHWPGTIQPGQVSDHVGYFGDLLATACDLAGSETPPHTDSISFLPTLRGQAERPREHEYRYWEFFEGESAQAVRWDHWKAIRKPMLTGRSEVDDIARDPAERYNLARRKDLVETARKLLAEAHVPHPHWVVPQAK